MVLGDVKESQFYEIWDVAKEIETEAMECFKDPHLDIHDFIVISILMGSTAEHIRKAIESYSDGSYADEDKDYGKELLVDFLRRNVQPYILNMESAS
jgi:hypothetical protein